MDTILNILTQHWKFVLLALVGLYIFATYNGLIRKKNDVENSFASIDVMLKKRYDLLPNLIETVKKYMTHEQDTLTKITELRAKATNPNTSTEDKIQLNNQLNAAMGGLMVQVENYPELKASDNFMQLQRSMNEIEEQLSASRRAFNAMITVYNNAVELFPSSLIARMTGFQRRTLFEISEKERQNVDVKTLFGS